MEKRKIILPTKRFFKSPDEDLDIRIKLDESENLLRENDKNIILDIAELYNEERNDSKKYKIYGKIKMVFRNMYSGATSYVNLADQLYQYGVGETLNNTGWLPYNEFAFLRNDVLREINLPQTGSTPSFTQNVVLSGYTGHTTITPMDAPYHNWNVYLSYVYSGDTTHPIKYTLSGGTTYTFTAGDGLPFRFTTGVTTHTLTCPVEHGISAGEYITLYGGSLTGLTSGRTFYVNSVGNEIYNSEKYVINLSNSQFKTGVVFSDVVTGKRCLDIRNISGTTSTYYVHKHKTLTSVGDYILDKVGFESPIWEDEKKLLFENFSGRNDFLVERNRMESVLYDFKTPFVLTGITNNLGYTPTEVYVTLILRNGNGYFDYPPKVGYKFNFHDTWIDNHFSGTTKTSAPYDTELGTGTTFTRSSITFTSGNTLTIGTSGLTGAFIEYNSAEFKERVISESYHKFYSPTTIFDYGQTQTSVEFSGATASNPFGLFYQPHYKVKLRELSPYIETSKTNDVINIPENTRYFKNEGLWKWRDLYDHGYIDTDGYGTDYPFVNGIHYVKSDINFYLKNEKIFTNKKDGISKFKKIIC